MNLLFVAFEFPPLAFGGVHRPLAFIKYLPEFGIRPIVVTTDENSYREVLVDPPLDASLLQKIPGDATIKRIPCSRAKPRPTTKFGDWRRIFFSLAEEAPKLWEPRVMACVDEIAREHRVEAIYATAPPFHIANVGCQMARRLSFPLVLDLRDAWSQFRVGPYATWLHYFLTTRIERRCLMSADRVVTTSRQTREDFLRIHPQVPEEKIVVITNGYDRDINNWSLSGPSGSQSGMPDALTHPLGTLSHTLREGSMARPTSSHPFVIGYVGTFYYSPGARAAMMLPWWRKPPHRMIQYSPRKEDWLYRSPWFFLQAVARLLADHPEYGSRLRIRFAGCKPDWIDAQVKSFGLGRNVEFLGPLDHAASIKFQEECDALLVTSSKVIGGTDYSIAGKTFEYFSMCKPIIGFAAEGAQRDILSESGLALICDPDSSWESANKLRELIEGRLAFTPKVVFLKALHRRELARSLAGVVKECALVLKRAS